MKCSLCKIHEATCTLVDFFHDGFPLDVSPICQECASAYEPFGSLMVRKQEWHRPESKVLLGEVWDDIEKFERSRDE